MELLTPTEDLVAGDGFLEMPRAVKQQGHPRGLSKELQFHPSRMASHHFVELANREVAKFPRLESKISVRERLGPFNPRQPTKTAPV